MQKMKSLILFQLHDCLGVSTKTAQLSQINSIVMFLVKQNNQAKEEKEEEEEEQQYKKKRFPNYNEVSKMNAP